jgi:hypothetical protein
MSWGARFAFTGHSRGFSEVSIGHPAGFLIFTAPPAGSVARYGRITDARASQSLTLSAERYTLSFRPSKERPAASCINFIRRAA